MWLWVNFPSRLFKVVIERLRDADDIEKHIKFWDYLKTIYNKDPIYNDDSVSFGKPNNKMPIEKYFALHVNINNIVVKKQEAFILR